MARTVRLAAALGALTLLAACGSDGSGAPPTWKPKPSFQGENVVPGNPQPRIPQSTPPPSNDPSQPSSSPGQNGSDPNVVATDLNQPTALAIMPDNTALVGERTTGRIVRVQPMPDQPVPTVRTLPGIDATGGGGLLDLALSPHYAQDNLIFAYVTTATDNRVVTFTLQGPVTPVLEGIPRGKNDNAGRIAFAPDGSLLVATGDAGKPALAADPSSLAGKLLRVTDIGKAAPGNPTAGSRVFTTGSKDVAGLCVSLSPARVYTVESRPDGDPVNLIRGGANYGWPGPGTGYVNPLGHLPTTSRDPGGCAVLDKRVFITSLDGQALLQTTVVNGGLGKFTVSLRGKYGRLHTVVPAADGALWITTANRDGAGDPKPVDDRVLRIVPSGGEGGSVV